MKIVRRIAPIAALVVLWAFTGFPLRAEQSRWTKAQVRSYYEAQAYAGDSTNQTEFEQDMREAGATSAEIAAEKQRLEEILKEAQKAGRNTGDDQNRSSGDWEWNLGQVYHGYTYQLTFPLTNNCRIPQLVKMTYPKTIDLTGPESVMVPAKKTIDVPLVLKVPKVDVPSGPIPLGMNIQCLPAADEISMKHDGQWQTQVTPFGKYSYVCNESYKRYAVVMHRHFHGEPEPPDGPPGRKKNTCDIYWETGEFTPDKEHVQPEQCRPDIERLAFEMLTQEIAPLQKLHDPGTFAWLPPAVDPSKAPADILKRALGGMSLDALLGLRRAADQFVRGLQGPTFDVRAGTNAPAAAGPSENRPALAPSDGAQPTDPKSNIRRP